MGAHALRGEVRVRFFGDSPENLLRAGVVFLAADEDDPAPAPFEVSSIGTGRTGEMRLALAGIDDREAAESLSGRLVVVDPEQLAPLADDEFYWHELVGCTVVARDGREIGIVREIWETGAHDVLVVESAAGKRHLLSTARELMPEVDPDAGRIVVELLPGMLDEG